MTGSVLDIRHGVLLTPEGEVESPTLSARLMKDFCCRATEFNIVAV